MYDECLFYVVYAANRKVFPLDSKTGDFTIDIIVLEIRFFLNVVSHLNAKLKMTDDYPKQIFVNNEYCRAKVKYFQKICVF